MRKAIMIFSALALASGVALADRGRHEGGGRDDNRGPVVQQHQNGGGWNGGGWSGGGNRGGNWNGGNRGGNWGARGGASWSGGVNVSPSRDRGWDRRPVIMNRGFDRDRGARFERRPIYIQRPVIRQRYYDYYQRPQIVVENQAPMDGYIFVAGAWSWTGYEWTWTAGHYEADPAYGYDNGSYDNGSYDSGYYNGY
jgi:hypothetical protein